MSQSESAFATRIVCDDFSACVFCFFGFSCVFRPSQQLEEEDAETRGQNYDALARRLRTSAVTQSTRDPRRDAVDASR